MPNFFTCFGAHAFGNFQTCFVTCLALLISRVTHESNMLLAVLSVLMSTVFSSDVCEINDVDCSKGTQAASLHLQG